jgi:23S rRNA (guanosine2251-2'-O)-methyltransferase
MRTFVILHDIRSAHNVGSIFRTADGAGVTKLYLCGYTPAPTDRFGRVVEDIEKTSLGATESVPSEHFEHTSECVKRLQSDGVRIVAVEQHARAVPHTTLSYDGDVAFIFGNEIVGVPENILELADDIIHIPMHGMKESLNVSVSAGIVLFAAIRDER